MKKIFLLALSLALTFTICACADNVADTTNTDANAIETEGTAEPNVVELNIGETVTTDIVEFSLTRFEFADKLKNATFQTGKTPDPEYLLPTETVQSNNPFAADSGNVMISFSYTLKNIGKEELNFPVNLGIVADYNDGFKFEAKVHVIKGEYVITKDTTNLAPLNPACEGRGYIKVPLEVMENTDASLYLSISVPTDYSGSTADYICKIR